MPRRRPRCVVPACVRRVMATRGRDEARRPFPSKPGSVHCVLKRDGIWGKTQTAPTTGTVNSQRRLTHQTSTRHCSEWGHLITPSSLPLPLHKPPPPPTPPPLLSLIVGEKLEEMPGLTDRDAWRLRFCLWHCERDVVNRSFLFGLCG